MLNYAPRKFGAFYPFLRNSFSSNLSFSLFKFQNALLLNLFLSYRPPTSLFITSYFCLSPKLHTDKMGIIFMRTGHDKYFYRITGLGPSKFPQSCQLKIWGCLNVRTYWLWTHDFSLAFQFTSFRLLSSNEIERKIYERTCDQVRRGAEERLGKLKNLHNYRGDIFLCVIFSRPRRWQEKMCYNVENDWENNEKCWCARMCIKYVVRVSVFILLFFHYKRAGRRISRLPLYFQ